MFYAANGFKFRFACRKPVRSKGASWNKNCTFISCATQTDDNPCIQTIS